MLRLYNTIARAKQDFRPATPGLVTMYTCGPTVYRDVHLGNLRSFLLADWLKRALIEMGYQVKHVKNITDVGHMRQEMLERGEDRVVAEALARGQTPQQIAEHYTRAFLRDEARVGILPADWFPKATEHIPDMIAIIERLFERGLAYLAGGNVYFDVGRFPQYGRLSGNLLRGLLEGVRMHPDPLKRDPRDFTLWKAAEPGRTLKWPSPWGDGFPGWHIECSAMSTKYLGTAIDIHTGGVDNIFPHHEDEIAQSEGAFGQEVVRFWVHGQHLLADGVKMAKSTGNSYILSDLESRGFDPLAFRYLCLNAHYRSRLNFNMSTLRAAQRALDKLRAHVQEWTQLGGWPQPAGGAEWRRQFRAAVEDDLNLPRALAVVWQLARSTEPPARKLALILEFDRVLGLDLEVAHRQASDAVVRVAATCRGTLRAAGRYLEADALRQRLAAEGVAVRDTPSGTAAIRGAFHQETGPRLISSWREVPSLLEQPSLVDFSVNILSGDHLGDLQRCVESTLRWAEGHQIEVLVVQATWDQATTTWLEEMARRDPRLRVLRTDHNLGEAGNRNVGLRQSAGRHVVILDNSVEVVGDIYRPIARALETPSVGMVGRWGLRSYDMRQFFETDGPEVDAVEAYCIAFRRERLAEVGWMDERFRFYRNLDLEYGFRFRSLGYRLMLLPDLPLARHEHRLWAALDPDERDRLSKRNFYLFLRKWHHHTDLLLEYRPS